MLNNDHFTEAAGSDVGCAAGLAPNPIQRINPAEAFDVHEAQAFLVSKSRRLTPSASQSVAWDRFYSQTQPRILWLLRPRLRQAADLEDCAQELWYVLLLELTRCVPALLDQGIDPWISQIAVLQRPRQRKASWPFSSLESHGFEILSPWDGPDELAQRREWRLVVESALTRLSELGQKRSSLVIHLRSIEERSVEETAVHLGWTLKHVRNEHCRAKQALRGLIQQQVRNPFSG